MWYENYYYYYFFYPNRCRVELGLVNNPSTHMNDADLASFKAITTFDGWTYEPTSIKLQKRKLSYSTYPLIVHIKHSFWIKGCLDL